MHLTLQMQWNPLSSFPFLASPSPCAFEVRESEEEERKHTDMPKFHSISLPLRHNRWTVCQWNCRYLEADLWSCSIVTYPVQSEGVCVHTSVYLKQTDNCPVCELKIHAALAYLWYANANCTRKSIAARKCLGSAVIHSEVYKQPRNHSSQCLHPVAQIYLVKAQRSSTTTVTWLHLFESSKEGAVRDPLVKFSVVTTLLFAHNS